MSDDSFADKLVETSVVSDSPSDASPSEPVEHAAPPEPSSSAPPEPTSPPPAEPVDPPTPLAAGTPPQPGAITDPTGENPIEPTAHTDETPPPQTIFDIADSMGVTNLRDKYVDEDAALHGLLHAHRLVGERDADAAYGREFRQYQPQFEDWRNAQGQPPEPEAPADAGPPEFDERWIPYLDASETGLIIPKADSGVAVPPEVVRQAQAHADYNRERQKQLANFDPDKVREEAKREAIEEFEARQQQQQVQNDAHRIVQHRASEGWMMQTDASGRMVQDPITGEPVRTPQGQAYLEACSEFFDMGIKDPVKIDQLAMLQLQGQYQQQANYQQQATPAQPQQQQPAPVQQPRVVQPPPPPPPGGTRTANTENGSLPPTPNPPGRSLAQALLASNKNAAANGEITYRPG